MTYAHLCARVLRHQRLEQAVQDTHELQSAVLDLNFVEIVIHTMWQRVNVFLAVPAKVGPTDLFSSWP
jgi:hypothetical protein